MPLDSIDFPDNPLLAKLGRVERLLATEQQWCKGRLRDADGRYCLAGAIEAADAWQEIPRIILHAAREVSGKRYWRIESFNDDPHTTHRDVLRVLHRARQDIIAQMAYQRDPQPWHRKWLQSLRSLYPASSYETGAVLSIGRPASPADDLQNVFGHSGIREDTRVS